MWDCCWHSSCGRVAGWDKSTDPHLPGCEVQWHRPLGPGTVHKQGWNRRVWISLWGGWGKKLLLKVISSKVLSCFSLGEEVTLHTQCKAVLLLPPTTPFFPLILLHEVIFFYFFFSSLHPTLATVGCTGSRGKWSSWKVSMAWIPSPHTYTGLFYLPLSAQYFPDCQQSWQWRILQDRDVQRQTDT